MTIDITMMNMADYDDMIALWQATEGVDVGESDAPEKVSAFWSETRRPALSHETTAS